jgi:transcriptional regulator with XRE-family HTH domain
MPQFTQRNTDILRRFGATVRHQRHRLGLSQQAFADRAGVHRTYLADIERGVRNIALTLIAKLAAAAEMPSSAFIAPLSRIALPVRRKRGGVRQPAPRRSSRS